MEHIFRIVLLYAVFLVPTYFMEIDDKFIIQIGGMLGITVAYVVSILILKRMKKKKEQGQGSEQR
jgi:hypothetical protein